MKPIKLLIQISDTHCGSDVGLAPPEITLRSGNKITFGDNLHQQWLWQNWNHGVEWVRRIIGKDRAALAMVGDATEGVHHHNSAELIAAEMEKHVEMAKECLKPYADLCSKIYVVKGTACHVGEGESWLAKDLKAEGFTAKDKWFVKFHGCLVDMAHHMPTTGRAYLEASGMSIAMGNARLNSIRAGHEVAKVFLRGHRHCGGHFNDGSGLFCVTGSWQVLTRHGFKVVTDSIPRPSILILDWRDKPYGALPTVHERYFLPDQDPIHEA